ncbi:class II glutamine amidotransferase [Massilia sp. TWP1-3-3]|uniref:class II glutamine amidotransferase n=1 Tax=Massilia sp. TWP1-3-3 TaxID=2804573 RepID=UPI003CFB8045
MCQLLGMNSSKPAALGFSFAGFAQRGGRTGEHKDGWGIAYHDPDRCHLITDQLASSDSPLARQVSQAPQRSRNVLAHIRKATQGLPSPDNSHPFTRLLWGRTWSFAHNGNLEAFHPLLDGAFRSIGQTDSERAFCFLLTRLQARFPARAPGRADLFAAIADIAASVARYGSFNFLLSDGEVLFAHCSTHLHYVVREYPFRRAHLIDCNVAINFGQHNHLDDRMSVIATTPLTTGEAWHAFAPGELKMFAHGAPCAVGDAAATAPACMGLAISY